MFHMILPCSSILSLSCSSLFSLSFGHKTLSSDDNLQHKMQFAKSLAGKWSADSNSIPSDKVLKRVYPKPEKETREFAPFSKLGNMSEAWFKHALFYVVFTE